MPMPSGIGIIDLRLGQPAIHAEVLAIRWLRVGSERRRYGFQSIGRRCQ